MRRSRLVPALTAFLLLAFSSPGSSQFTCSTTYIPPEGMSGEQIDWTCNGGSYQFCCGCSVEENGYANCYSYGPGNCGWNCSYYIWGPPWGTGVVNYWCDTGEQEPWCPGY